MDAKIGAYGALPSAELPTTTTRPPPRRDRLVLWNSAHTVCARDAVRGAPQYALYFWMHGVPTAPADNAP